MEQNKISVADPLKHIKGLVPPQELDLEEAVLGSILDGLIDASMVMDILNADAFYNMQHQIIFKAICELYIAHNHIDLLTVSSQLRKSGEFELAGGAYYITSLNGKAVQLGNIETHCRIIKEAYIKRELIKVCANTISKAYVETSDAFDLIDDIAKVYDFLGDQIGKALVPIADAVKDRLKAYGEKFENGITGVPSGLKSVDQITSGWQPSDLVIIAARPAMGKTAFVMNCARNAAVDYKKPTLIFSLEMSTPQLVDRLLSSESEIDAETIKKRTMQDYEWQRMHQAAITIHNAPMIIDDTPALSIPQFIAKSKKAKKDHDIQLIVIDYLQLMRGVKEKGSSGNREQEIGSISRALKAVAKELNVPVLALSQLSRAVENRPGAHGKRPRLSDLRESGSIEQDADMVLFLYRPEYYGVTEDEQGRSTAGVGEVLIAKHRNGDTGTAVTRFIGKYVKFVDLEENYFSDFTPSDPTAGLSRSVDFDTYGDPDAPF